MAISLTEGTFVRLALSGAVAATADTDRVLARRVDLKGQPHLSLTFRQAAGDKTQNLPLGEALAWARSQIGAAYRNALLSTTQRNWQLHVPAQGRPRLVRHKPSTTEPPSRAHDLARETILDASASDWLHGLGVTDKQGKVRAAMADKHRQICHYVELLSHLAKECGWTSATDAQAGRVTPCAPSACQEAPGSGPPALPALVENQAPHPPALSPRPTMGEEDLVIADMGCGKGYLTFGAWHLLKRKWQRSVRVIGVEARAGLVQFTSRVAKDVHAEGLEFVSGAIESAPLPPLDGLIALHACNTATDAAILRGIELGAKLIVVAPCCHKELRPQLRHPDALAPLLRHGIMEERLAEWLTDGLRALYLEWAGYRTKVMEFVSTEHTSKNLMIAAIKCGEPCVDEAARARIVRLKEQFGMDRLALDPLLAAADVRRLRSDVPTEAAS